MNLSTALSFASLLIAALTASVAPAAEKTMNGISLSQFGNFRETWHLVTVRFRRDTNEQRFTYANDAAWNTLQTNSVSYPDGAAFAKVAYQTRPDPAFESSAVPSGARRIQIMLRNQAAYSATDGWGYALFSPEGNLLEGDPHAAMLACAACHHLVASRGFVFSQLMSLSAAFSAPTALTAPLALPFEERPVSSLPKKLRARLRTEKRVRVLTGPLADHYFSGTFDELRPALSREAARTRLPCVFLPRGGTDFSLVMKNDSLKCDTAKGEIGLRAVYSIHDGAEKKVRSQEISFCYGRST